MRMVNELLTVDGPGLQPNMPIHMKAGRSLLRLQRNRAGSSWLREENGDGKKSSKARPVVGDPSRIRTCNPRSRNPLLYPVELWDRCRRYSIANMKNPLPRQARSEPFCAIQRQSQERRTIGFGSPPAQGCATAG